MKRQRGFSLAELLIAVVISLFLIAATFSVLGISSASVRSTGQMTQLQEAARLALRLLEEDLTQAGFFSDLSTIDLSPNTNTTFHGSVTGADCVGGGRNNGTFPNGIGHFRTLWAARRGTQAAISCETEAKEVASKMNDDSPYPVYFFKTDTSGEKLYEEFYTSEDKVNFNLYESIGVITNPLKPTISDMEVTIKEIETLFKRESYNKEDIIKIMNKILPNFNHIETGKSLDQKM